MVRELGIELDKKIRIVTEGGDAELDRQLIEVIRDPLTHIIRNCADHGLEKSEVRVSNGKPPVGEIRVCAYQEAGQFVIDITDDGSGIDVDRVAKKAVASGLVREADLARMSKDDICRLIFEPGFSTASAVTSVSGRGVGMDVVRSNVESVRGSVTLSTNLGKGTRLILRIPLTLAIAPALIVEAAGVRLALPQHSVAEVVEVRTGKNATVKRVKGKLMVDLRGEVMPAVELSELLGIKTKDAGSEPGGLVIVVRASTMPVGLLVDSVADVQEIVVKPTSRSLSDLNIFSGQTILGDGSVLLIVDPPSIVRMLGGGAARAETPKVKEAGKVETSRLVLCRAGSGVMKAMPASVIARIEQVNLTNLQRSDAGLLMTYQERLIPIVELIPVDALPGTTATVIVVSVSGITAGFMVEKKIDIVEDHVDINLLNVTPGSIGSCRIKDDVIDLIDLQYHLENLRSSFPAPNDKAIGKILMLAGDPRSMDLLAPLIKSAGYTVSTAGSFEAAISVAETGGAIDVVLIDLAMAENRRQELKGFAGLLGDAPFIGLTDGQPVLESPSPAELSMLADRLDCRRLLELIGQAIAQAA